MAVFGYTRVSTTMQMQEEESLLHQRRQLERYVQVQGWNLEHVFEERAVSGAKPLSSRPEGAALLARLQRDDVIIASKLDRVFRSALDALSTVEELRRDGVSLHLIDLEGDVSRDGLAKMFLTIATAFAEAERDRFRERITGVKADQRSRGRYLGGAVPFGYEIDRGFLVEKEDEQAAIQTILALRREGMSLRRIADEIETGHNVHISHVVVNRILATHSKKCD